jgi:hypothetical protein
MRVLGHKGVLSKRYSDEGVAIAVPVRDVDVYWMVGVAIAVPVRDDRRGSRHFEVNVSLMVVRMLCVAATTLMKTKR